MVQGKLEDEYKAFQLQCFDEHFQMFFFCAGQNYVYILFYVI